MTNVIPNKFKTNKRTFIRWIILLAVIVIIVFIIVWVFRIDTLKIDVNIYYDDQFIIVICYNLESWYNVDFILNFSDDLSSGYKCHHDVLSPGVTQPLTYDEFEKDDGTIFDYNVERPIKLFIQAKTLSGKTYSYLKTWGIN